MVWSDHLAHQYSTQRDVGKDPPDLLSGLTVKIFLCIKSALKLLVQAVIRMIDDVQTVSQDGHLCLGTLHKHSEILKLNQI